jgi:hypothetical protein
MPRIAVKGLTDMAMSPSGKLLAVSGTAGFEVFHFNGSKPITHYTGLLTNNQVDQLYWDNEQPPVCHQPVRQQAIRIYDHADERQPSPWLAPQDNQTAEYRRSVQEIVFGDGEFRLTALPARLDFGDCGSNAEPLRLYVVRDQQQKLVSSESRFTDGYYAGAAVR